MQFKACCAKKTLFSTSFTVQSYAAILESLLHIFLNLPWVDVLALIMKRKGEANPAPNHSVTHAPYGERKRKLYNCWLTCLNAFKKEG